MSYRRGSTRRFSGPSARMQQVNSEVTAKAAGQQMPNYSAAIRRVLDKMKNK